MSPPVIIAGVIVFVTLAVRTLKARLTSERLQWMMTHEAGVPPNGNVFACEPFLTVAFNAGSKKRLGSLAGS